MTDDLELHAYLDGELSEDEVSKFESRLEGDYSLRSRLETLRAMRHALREKVNGVPDGNCWRACRDRMDEIDSAKRAEGFVGRWQWAMAGALGVSLLAAGFFNRMQPANDVNPSSLPVYASAMSPARGEVADRFGFSRWANEVRVVGAFEGVREGKVFYRMDLRDRDGSFSLWVFPDGAEVAGKTKDGFCRYILPNLNCLGWNESGNAYMLTSDRTHRELEVLADRYFRRN